MSIKLSHSDMADWLNTQADKYLMPTFVDSDPLQVAKQFSLLQDIEIAAFFTCTIAWGKRSIIINNGNRLMQLMDNAPYDFILNHQPSDLQRLGHFVHRTFQPVDLFYCLRALQAIYQEHNTLERAFSRHITPQDIDITNALIGFHQDFFALENPTERTRKHIATPLRKSACKRICMYLRWMVRPNTNQVDFGLWKEILPAQLIIPIDVHVARVARYIGLLERDKDDWQAAQELTQKLRLFDPIDPVRYDFALFGIGEDLGKAAFV